ncbi:GntR family transcriptional regulator [Corynebacterium sp. S7]
MNSQQFGDGGPYSQPVYRTIASWIREQIISGQLARGDKLPAESELADKFHVARATIRNALEILQLEGLIDRRRGRNGGTFVRAEPPAIELTRIEGILPQMRERGVDVDSSVLKAEKVAASTSLAQLLEVKVGSPLFNIVRLRRFDGVPSLLEDSYFPAEVFPRMLEADLTQSIYELLQNLQHRPTSKVERVTGSGANVEERELLNTTDSINLLRISRVARDENGLAIEYSNDLLRSDSTQIQVRTGETFKGKSPRFD